MLLVYGPLAAAVIGVCILITALRSNTRLSAHPRGKAIVATASAVLVVAGLLFTLLGMNLQPYVRFSPARPVALVAVKALYPVAHTFSVTVTRLDGSKRTTTCILQGDSWALSGARQSWSWWALGLNLAPTYSVDAIISRRNGTTQQPVHTSCSLAPPRPKLTYYLPGGMIHGLVAGAIRAISPLTQAQTRPLADGALYRVEVMEDGFVSTPQLIPPQMAAAGEGF